MPEDDALAGRQPPHDTEAEAAVLGALLLGPDAFDAVEGRLQPEDFFTPAYAAVFRAMTELRRRGEPIDLHLLRGELERSASLESAGGLTGLAGLMDVVATAAHAGHYADVVRQKAVLRRLVTAGSAIVDQATRPGALSQEVLDEAERAVFEVGAAGASGEAESIAQVLKSTWDKIEAFHGSQGTVTGLPTDYFELDRYTAGLHEQELIIVAGRPAMGKSTFALNLVRRVALDHGAPSLLFSLEMSAENLVQNMLCAHARIDAQRLRTGKLTKEEWTHLGRSTDALGQAPLWIDDTPAISLAELRGKARRLRAREGVRFVAVDYLQLVTASTLARGRSREQEISEISRGLKALAKELDITVLALAQLNRKPEGRQDNRPILSDLRESGAIEQDADVVLLLHRPEYYEPTPENEGRAEVIIAKQRNGPTGTVTLTFINDQLRFENLASGAGAEPVYTGAPEEDEAF